MFQKYSRPLGFIFNSYKKHKILLLFMILGKISEAVFMIVLPILAKMEMDQLAEKNEQLFGIIEASSFNIFIIILIIIFVGQLIQNLITQVLRLFDENYLAIYKNDFTKTVFERMKNSSPWVFLNSRNQRFVYEILANAWDISGTIQEIISDSIRNILILVWISGILISIDWKIFVILIFTTILMYFLERYQEFLREKQWVDVDYKFRYIIWECKHQIRSNFPQLISSGGFTSTLNRLHNTNEEQRKLKQQFQIKFLFFNIASFVIENISVILLKLIVGFSVFAGTTSLGTMTMTLLYIEKMRGVFDYIRTFRFRYISLVNDLLQFDIFLDLTENRDSEKFLKNWTFDKIIFKNVAFHYPNFAKHEIKYLEIIEKRIKKLESGKRLQEELEVIAEARKELAQTPPQILDNINLTFEVGKTYGIVGKNGAGKTTIISLLQNFFDNYKWNILYGNTEVREFSREFFEKNIAIINQIPYIVLGASIRENILFGVEKSYTDDEIMALLAKFGLDKKIKKNLKWLDAEIGYDNDFSGWEKQLIVLARIIFQDKKILIMDEGTNQLDAENELIVMEELLKHKKDKIVIFITHRMTSIRKVDMIYCLKDGKIETSGTHQELIDNDNMYNYCWKTQVEN